jgi:hypothetical protein
LFFLGAGGPATSNSSRSHAARFELVQRLGGPEWSLSAPPWDSSWSPDGRRLVLVHRGIFVVAERTAAGFTLYQDSRIHDSFTWSPDGEWIAYESQRSVVVIHLRTTEAETLATGMDLWPVIWGSDGAIYGWSHHERYRFVPKAFRVAQSLPHRNRLLLVPGGMNLLFRPGEPASESDVTTLACSPCLGSGPFAGGRFFLVTTSDNDRNGYALLDSSAKLIRRIPVAVHSGEITWTSISPDGYWVVGYLGHEVGEGAIIASDLYLCDSTGTWRTSVANAGDASLPEYCPTEEMIAFSDPVHGGVSIGRIVTR